MLRRVDERGAGVVEVRADVQERYNQTIQQRLARTVWNVGGCRSWYLDRNGRNSALWPGATWRFRRFDSASYTLRAAAREAAATR